LAAKLLQLARRVRFLLLLDVRTQATSSFAMGLLLLFLFYYHACSVRVVEHQRRLWAKSILLPVVFLRCKYAFVKELTVLTSVECIVLSYIVLIILVRFRWFKLFLFIDRIVFVVVDQNWVILLFILLICILPTYHLTETNAEVIELVILKVLGMVDECVLITKFIAVVF